MLLFVSAVCTVVRSAQYGFSARTLHPGSITLLITVLIDNLLPRCVLIFSNFDHDNYLFSHISLLYIQGHFSLPYERRGVRLPCSPLQTHNGLQHCILRYLSLSFSSLVTCPPLTFCSFLPSFFPSFLPYFLPFYESLLLTLTLSQSVYPPIFQLSSCFLPFSHFLVSSSIFTTLVSRDCNWHIILTRTNIIPGVLTTILSD